MVVEAAPALPQTCCPTVWLWPGQLLYAGPAFDLAPHSGSVWCVAVGLNGPLRVRIAGMEVAAGSLLIPPRTTYHLVNPGEKIVACYLDPASLRAESVRRAFTAWRGELGYHHRDEAHLVAESSALCGADGDEQAQRWLDVVAPRPQRQIDPRIADAARRISEDPTATISSHELAAIAGLSESRFLHLFRREAGTTLRRYRLWIRLMHAWTALAAGRDITTAAMGAGFASPSHLADRFRFTFGSSATQMLATGMTLRTSESLTGSRCSSSPEHL